MGPVYTGAVRNMFRLINRALNLCNRRVGVSLERTLLYQISSSYKPVTPSSSTNVSWEVINIERVNCLSEIARFDVDQGLRWLRRGDLCYVAYLNGRLAHFTWVQRSGTHLILEAGRNVTVESGDFWLYYSLTSEWARGNGLHTAILKRINSDHFVIGYRRGYIYTNCDNIASQKAILRAGFSLVETLGALRVGSHYYRLG
jgi:hypothetical protein